MNPSDAQRSGRPSFPGGARFAFTVLDDTDDSTVDNVKPVYEYLAELGLGATKTVWPFAHDGPSHFWACQTLEDPAYLEFVLELRRRGFEITWHGASFESSPRERTLEAIERFVELFHTSPRVHANHANNRENLYWGPGRVDYGWLSRLLRNLMAPSEGHVEGSPYWWGDACRKHVRYGRNLTFSRLNLASINPSMPYADPRRPLVPLWFSAADAETVTEFNELTAPANQERLEREGGFTIVATHFGKQFVRDGILHATTRKNLAELSRRQGWFPTVGELLDWLADQREERSLPASEWRRMQLRWAFDLVARRLALRAKAWRKRRRVGNRVT